MDNLKKASVFIQKFFGSHCKPTTSDPWSTVDVDKSLQCRRHTVHETNLPRTNWIVQRKKQFFTKKSKTKAEFSILSEPSSAKTRQNPVKNIPNTSAGEQNCMKSIEHHCKHTYKNENLKFVDNNQTNKGLSLSANFNKIEINKTEKRRRSRSAHDTLSTNDREFYTKSNDDTVKNKTAVNAIFNLNFCKSRKKFKTTKGRFRKKEPKSFNRKISLTHPKRLNIILPQNVKLEFPTTPETLLEQHKRQHFLDSTEEWLVMELNEYECLIDGLEVIKIIACHSKFFEVEPADLWREFFDFVEEIPSYDDVINYDVWQEFRDKRYCC